MGTGPALTDGNWYHVKMTITPGTSNPVVQFSINGVADQTTTTPYGWTNENVVVNYDETLGVPEYGYVGGNWGSYSIGDLDGVKFSTASVSVPGTHDGGVVAHRADWAVLLRLAETQVDRFVGAAVQLPSQR